MTKVVKARCDNCGREWLSESPPIKEAYEAQRIHVESMSVLLPDKTVMLRHKEGFRDVHALLINNKDFCESNCLADYIQKYMRGE